MAYGAALVADATQVRIRSIAHGGAGVGEVVDGDGRTWFVAGALPGELVTAEPEKSAKRFVRGHVLEVLEAGEARGSPPCPIAAECGGCGWQHVDAEAQIELKRRIVADQLRKLPLEIGGAVASPQPLGYRRRARLHYEQVDGQLRLGFLRARSHDVVDMDTCPVLRPELDRALQKARDLASYLPPSGELLGLSDGRQVVLGLPGVRPDPELMEACDHLLDETLVGVVVRGGRKRDSVGRNQLQIDGGDGSFAVQAGPFAFAQAQREQNAALVEHVVRSARPSRKRVLELYAGNGNFTRGLARHAERVWTFDENRESVAALRDLAKDRGLSINAKHGSAEGTLRKLAKAERSYDVVVLDPPRAGLGKDASRDLARIASERVVYVSCDPSTLARDLAVLVDAGFRVEDVRVFDLMPMTPEVETVATLLAPRRGGRS